MLFLHRQRLVFLSVPKTASTSVEHALLPHAGIAFTASPALKHMGYTAFVRDVAPLIERGHGLTRPEYIVVAVMREPVSWVYSWYRYRSREDLRDPKAPNRGNYCGHVSFSDFVRAYCSADPPPYARIGNQLSLVLNEARQIGVDRIFPYEALDSLAAFLTEEIGAPVGLPRVNESPPGARELDLEAEGLLRRKLGRAIAIHGRLRPDGWLREPDRAGAA